MPEALKCPRCGATLPSEGWEGLCPKCIVRISIETPPDHRRDDLRESHSPQPPDLDSQSSSLPSDSGRSKIRYFGDYELLEEIARGGMGVVYKARQRSLNRLVAVKMILSGEYASPEFVQRFRTEAEAAANLSHPNIVAIYEIGEHDGQQYFSMEYVEGDNLAEWSAKCKTRNTEWCRGAAQIVATVAEAIHFAHQHGILHRDLKPSNILIDQFDQPRITDFGLAKRLTNVELGTRSAELTLTGQVLGSPNYMPPEQAEGKHRQATVASDIYSLGAILYHLLTGRPPFAAETVTDTLQKLLQTEPSSLRQLNPNVSRDLETICLKCLEKDPRRRYASGQAFADELERFLHHEPIHARPAGPAARFGRWCRRKPALATSLLLVLLLVLILAIGSPIAIYRINHERRTAQHSLVGQYVANGNRLVQEKDYLGALAWFAQALKEDAETPERAKIHRLRLMLTMQQCPKLAQLYSHEGNVNDAEFSPDGKWVLSASDDHTARIWDAVSGELRIPPLQHASAVHHAGFSSDSRWVVTASADHTARVWDAATGKPRTPSLRHNASVNFATFSQDGRLVLTVSDDKTAQIWNSATGEPIGPALQHKDRVNHGSFSPDGHCVATACEDGTATIWNAQTGKPQRPSWSASGSNNRDVRLYLAQFSPDGTRLLTGGFEARLWDVATGQRVASLEHPEQLRHARFSPDGHRVVTASYDQTARVWDASTGNPVTPPLRHDRQVWSACFSPNGATLLTASMECNVRLWSAETGELLTGIIRQNGQVRNVSFSPDGRRFIVASQSHAIRVWDLAGAEPLVSHLSTSAIVSDVAFSPDGRLAILLTFSGEASAWNLITGEPLPQFGTNLSLVRCAQFSADGRLVALGSSDGLAVIREVSSGNLVLTALHHEGPVNHVEFSPETRRLASASGDNTASVWDLTSGLRITQMRHDGPVAYALFTLDGKQIVTATVNRQQAMLADSRYGAHLVTDPRADMYATSNIVQLWDAQTGKPVVPALCIPPAASFLSFSSDRCRVVNSCSAMGYQGEDAAYLNRGRTEVCVWDIRSGQKLSPDPLMGTADWVYAGFSPDGSKLVTTSIERIARTWDGYSGKSVSPVLHHGHEVYHGSFSPDSRLVATASKDGMVHLWESDTGEPVGPLLNHRVWHSSNPLSAVPVRVFFSPRGQRLVTYTRNQRTHVWELTTESHPRDGVLMAEILANATIDETGTLALLAPDTETARKERWRKLLTKYPSVLGVTAQQLSAWNRHQADDYYRLGRANAAAGQFIQAAANYSHAIEIDPYYQEAYSERGQTFAHLQEYEKAVADYKKEIEVRPESSSGYNNLGSLYANGPSTLRDPLKALPLGLRAVELAQGCCDELRTLGMVYYRLGQLEEALEILEKTAKASRAGATAYDFFFLAMTYSRLGQSAKAEECYAKAMDSWRNRPVNFSRFYERSMQRYSAEAEEILGKPKSQ